MRDKKLNRVIAIVGPTGVGKTKLALELAKKYNGEIINADAVQVYRGLDIGSAKVMEEEKEGIVHHLFDIKDVNEYYSVYDYQKDARMVIDDIMKRGKTPIMVGGTGLYLKSALYDYRFTLEKSDSNEYEKLETEELYEILLKINPNTLINKNNRKRIIRALIFYDENNTLIENNKTDKILYNVSFIGLTTDRNVLYDKINKRVDAMINNGLIDEVKSFYDRGIMTKPLLGGIGYRELYKYFDGEYTLDETTNKIKQNSRRYAKRQYTFFNHQIPTVWFETDYSDFSRTVEKVSDYLDNN